MILVSKDSSCLPYYSPQWCSKVQLKTFTDGLLESEELVPAPLCITLLCETHVWTWRTPGQAGCDLFTPQSLLGMRAQMWRVSMMAWNTEESDGHMS